MEKVRPYRADWATEDEKTGASVRRKFERHTDELRAEATSDAGTCACCDFRTFCRHAPTGAWTE
ncbi:MAG: hypothetical protein AMS25_03160 [Gemmatimonas sp. SM23_52]|nr:MAG: hypothetical protein AMS25_03160 [Gemmatimonas sp. SM23_52]